MTLLTMEEWSTEVERLGDELDALNRCCETARAQLAGLLDQNGAGAQPVPSGEALIQCVATVNIQRQHIRTVAISGRRASAQRSNSATAAASQGIEARPGNGTVCCS